MIPINPMTDGKIKSLVVNFSESKSLVNSGLKPMKTQKRVKPRPFTIKRINRGLIIILFLPFFIVTYFLFLKK